MSISDFDDRQLKFMVEELEGREKQLEKEFPRPLGMVELPEDEQVQKYVEFRTALALAAQGDEEATQVVQGAKDQLGLKEIAEDLVRVHPMFTRRVEDAS